MSGSSQHHGWVPWEKCWHAYWGQSVCRKCWSNLQGCTGRYGSSAHHSASKTDAKRSGILPQQSPREEITRGSSTCGWEDSHYMPAWKSCGTWAFLAGALLNSLWSFHPFLSLGRVSKASGLSNGPLIRKKLEAAQMLVLEQLAAEHIIPSASPWNTPIFVIKKKSGKWQWHLLQGLRLCLNYDSYGSYLARIAHTCCSIKWLAFNYYWFKWLLFYYLSASRWLPSLCF